MIKVSVGDVSLMCETVAEFFELAPYVQPFCRFVAPVVTVPSSLRTPFSAYPAFRNGDEPIPYRVNLRIEDTL